MRARLKAVSWALRAATLVYAGRTAPLPGDDPLQYEAQRHRHIAYMHCRLPHHLIRLTWTREQVLTEQTRALRALLRHAAAHSPWHARRLKGIDIERIDSATIDLVPTMTKADFMENWDEIITDRSITHTAAARRLAANADDFYMERGTHIVASGGSSGLPGLYAFDWHAWAAMALGPLRGLVALALKRGILSLGHGALIYADRAGHSSYALARTFSGRGQRMHQFPVTLPRDEIIAGLERLKPNIISCYSSYLPILTEAVRAGELTARPRLIWTSAEPMWEADRQRAEEVFGCPVVNTWGATESMGSMPAIGQPGFYMSDDMNLFEYVDARGRAIEPGETSDGVLISNLYSRLMPIIRYEMDDQFALSAEPAAWGLGYTHVDRVLGRADDVFRYDGVPVHPVVFWTVLDRVDHLVEFQIRQTPRGAEILVVCRTAIECAAIERELEQFLAKLGLPEPEVRLRIVDSIPRQATGKLKRFVPLGKNTHNG